MSAGSVNPEMYPIYNGEIGKLENGGDVCQTRQKGADGINAVGVQRGDPIVMMAGSKVHSNCHNWYTNPIDIKIQLSKKSGSSNLLKRRARAYVGPFNSKTDCHFCGTGIVPVSSDYSFVKTDS